MQIMMLYFTGVHTLFKQCKTLFKTGIFYHQINAQTKVFITGVRKGSYRQILKSCQILKSQCRKIKVYGFLIALNFDITTAVITELVVKVQGNQKILLKPEPDMLKTLDLMPVWRTDKRRMQAAPEGRCSSSLSDKIAKRKQNSTCLDWPDRSLGRRFFLHQAAWHECRGARRQSRRARCWFPRRRARDDGHRALAGRHLDSSRA